MALMSDFQFQKTKDFIFRNGRLLERKLFEYFFEDGSRLASLRALQAYQNPDGGFGNGLEPDLLCPDSTMIGAETALVTMDMLDSYDREICDELLRWIAAQQNERGTIFHPPPGMFNYPYQPWWQNPDEARILVLAGFLKKWGVEADDFYQKVRRYYEQSSFPKELGFYDYSFYLYLRYCGFTAEDRERLTWIRGQLPILFDKTRDHFPLLSRYWFCIADEVASGGLAQTVHDFMGAIQADGGLLTPYPELPWWRPIFTLDGLILLKKKGML